MNPIISTPDPTWTALVSTLVRSMLLLASAVGAYHGTISDSMVQVIAGALIAVGTAAWGVYDKYQAAQKDHAGSVESAKMATPLRIE